MIYICIPAHDEAPTIGVLLWKVRKVLGEFGRDYRIVVHEDASTDDTAAVLDRYRRSLPLTVLRSSERIGTAAGVERLLRHVAAESNYPKRDCAVVLQGDFTEDPGDLVALVKALEGGADIVAGCVSPDGSSLPKPVAWARRLSRIFLGWIVGRPPVSDPISGFRAYRVIVLRKAFRDLGEGERIVRSEGWSASVELLGRVAPHARKIGEVPIGLRYDLQVRESRVVLWPTVLGLARLKGRPFAKLPRASGPQSRTEATPEAAQEPAA